MVTLGAIFCVCFELYAFSETGSGYLSFSDLQKNRGIFYFYFYFIVDLVTTYTDNQSIEGLHI